MLGKLNDKVRVLQKGDYWYWTGKIIGRFFTFNANISPKGSPHYIVQLRHPKTEKVELVTFIDFELERI